MSTFPPAHYHQPQQTTPQPGDLWLGIGNPSHWPPELKAQTLVLTRYTPWPMAEELGHTPRAQPASVSQRVAGASAAEQASWRALFPHGLASVRRLVVEDASPDTCLALLLLSKVLEEEEALDALRQQNWLDYVSAWEQGFYLDDDIRRSPVCLLSALAHMLLPGRPQPKKDETEPKASSQTPAEPPDDESTHAALSACLDLLRAYVAGNESPKHAEPPSELPIYQLAASQLTFEEQHYRLALKHGIRAQLWLPLAAGGGRRHVLVDALLLADVALTGILKVLARTDQQHGWTGKGFTLLGIYRPQLQGTGDDMTVSLDPSSGLTLKTLWTELERLEDECWGNDRPRDQPRKHIAGYTNAHGHPTPGAPNQPWYDEGGRYTLLGAPRAVQEATQTQAAVLGSKLDWHDDVLPALWGAYKPFPDALRPVPLGNPLGNDPSKTSRRIAKVAWPRGVAEAAGRTHTLHQWLANCTSAQPGRHPGEFPLLRSLHIVELPGGDLVAHSQGLTLFDDWTPLDLDPALASAALELAELAQSYEALLKPSGQLKALLADAQALLAPGRKLGVRQVLDLRERAIALRGEWLALAAREAQLPAARGLPELRAVVEAAWGLPEARHQVGELLAHLDDLLTQAQSVQQERAQYWATSMVSIAALFFVLRDLIAVFANWQTMNIFELMAPIYQQLGVPAAAAGAAEQLTESARVGNIADVTTVGAMALVFFGGAVWAWWTYSRLGSGPVAKTRP